MSVNKVILIGNVGKDPIVREISSPTGNFKSANFSLACSEKWKDKSGEKREKTEWINCQATNGLAGIIEKYVGKGDKLYIEGKYKTSTWERKGEKQYMTFVEVLTMEMLGSRNRDQSPTNNNEPQQAEQEDEEENSPF